MNYLIFVKKNMPFKQAEDFLKKKKKNQEIPELRIGEDISCTSGSVVKPVVEIFI